MSKSPKLHAGGHLDRRGRVLPKGTIPVRKVLETVGAQAVDRPADPVLAVAPIDRLIALGLLFVRASFLHCKLGSLFRFRERRSVFFIAIASRGFEVFDRVVCRGFAPFAQPIACPPVFFGRRVDFALPPGRDLRGQRPIDRIGVAFGPIALGGRLREPARCSASALRKSVVLASDTRANARARLLARFSADLRAERRSSQCNPSVNNNAPIAPPTIASSFSST